MNISKMGSTIILATSFATVFLFALIFYLYSSINGISLDTLKDALSMTASFFGGIATLVAAYIATQLFYDWKEQQQFFNKLQLINKTIDSAGTFLEKISKVVELVVQIKHQAQQIMFNEDEDEDGSKMKKITELFDLLNNEKVAYVRSLNIFESHIYRYGVYWKDPNFPKIHNSILLLNKKVQEDFQEYESATHELELYKISDKILVSTKAIKIYIELEIIPFLDKKMSPTPERT